LSKRTFLALFVSSRASALLIRIPLRAPTPVATMMAVGVASPSAQGHAMIRTLTKERMALVIRGSGPKKNQTRKAEMPTAMTLGTKTPATLSARRCTGAFVNCASSTRRMTLARTVSEPIRAVLMVMEPLPLMVPPMTSSSGSLCTGMLSPVIIDSST